MYKENTTVKSELLSTILRSEHHFYRLSNSNLVVMSGRRNHFCYGDVNLTTMMAGLAVRTSTASYVRLERETREWGGGEGRWGEKWERMIVREKVAGSVVVMGTGKRIICLTDLLSVES